MAATEGECRLKSGETVNWLHEILDKKSVGGGGNEGRKEGEKETEGVGWCGSACNLNSK